MGMCTLPEINIFANENGWLEWFESTVPFLLGWIAYFQVLCPVSFGEG